MNYIALDMEWNQPVSRQKMIKCPIKFAGEIIQIGAVKINEQMEVIDTFNTYVKPVFYPKMNRSVEQLTSITDEELAIGMKFPDAIEEFHEWCGEESILLTWGPSDIYTLEDNLIMHNMSYDWIPEYYDAQMIFDDQIMEENRCFSLDYAVYYLGIQGNQGHDALNDAMDTASVIQKLDIKNWIKEEIEYQQSAS